MASFFHAAFIGLFFSSIFFHEAFVSAQFESLALRDDRNLMVLETDQVDLIFPAEALPMAERLAAVFSIVAEADLNTMGNRPPRHLKLLLRTDQGVGNGFVTGISFHSDWSLTPIPSFLFGSVPWTTTLAVHEYRHVVQIDHFMNSQFMRIMRIFFGDYAYGIVNISIPRWLLEGDAVVTETLLTNGGRGRVPGFDVAFRARILAEGAQHYDREIMPSFRRNSGNPYPFGYYFTTYLRREYGASILAYAGNDAVRQFPSFLPFARAISRRTNTRITELWTEAIEDVRQSWIAQQENRQITPAISLAFQRPNHGPRIQNGDTTPISYFDPVDLGEHGLIAMRSGFDYIPSVVRVSETGDEIIAHSPNALAEFSSLSGSASKIVWLEVRQRGHWAMSLDFVVRMHDFTTDQTSVVGPRGTFLHAAIHPNGDRIALLEFQNGYEPHLRILDLETETLVEDYPLDPLGSADSIAWADEDLLFVRQTPAGQVALSRLNRENGEMTDLISPSNEILHDISYQTPWIYYSSPYDGFDAIYALNEETLERFLVVSRPISARAPMPTSDQKLVFADYALAGSDISQAAIDPSTWRPLAEVEANPLDYFASIQDQDPSIAEQIADPPEVETQARSYRPMMHFIHPYGWYALPDFTQRRINVSVASANLLNTLMMQGQYGYSYEDLGHHAAFSMGYYGFMPILSLGANYDQRTALATINSEETHLHWEEQSVLANIALPFQSVRGAAQHSAELSSSFNYLHLEGDRFQDNILSSNAEQEWGSGRIQASYQVARRGSFRDLRSPLRLFLAGGLQMAQSEDDLASMGYLVSSLTFPTGLRHTSFQLSGSYILSEDEQIITENTFGWSVGELLHLAPEQMHLRANMLFPVLYPHWRVWSAAYITRLSMELFSAMDYLPEENQGENSFGSAGIGLFSTLHFLRFPVPITFGARSGLGFDGEPFFEITTMMPN